MPLPSSGTIWISQLRDEFGNWGPPNYLSHYYRGNLTTGNNTGVPTSGYISLAHFYGARKVQPGSADYTSPGTYTFVVPHYSTIRVRVWGAGGSGGARRAHASGNPVGSNGNSGGSSSAFGVVSGGGGGGLIGPNLDTPGGGGSGGTGQTLNGGNGETAPYEDRRGGNGGSSPFGGAGSPGVSGQNVWSSPGGFPGGGSGGTRGGGYYGAGGGGAGGYSDVTFTAGQPGSPVPGNSYTIVVGAGGAGASDPYGGGSGKGGDGRVIIDWS